MTDGDGNTITVIRISGHGQLLMGMETMRRDHYAPVKKLKGKEKTVQIEILVRRKERIVQTLLAR